MTGLMWRFWVPGSGLMVWFWAINLAFDLAYLAARDHLLTATYLFDLPLFLLNLLSWDYQRRHRTD